MSQPSPEFIAYAAFIVGASVEFYFFMMQRSALEIGRAGNVSRTDARLMLPLWYLIHWPFRLMKWAAVIFIALQLSWVAGVALLAIPFLCQIFVPIPHRQFIPIFRRKVAKEIATGENSGFYAALYKMLFDVHKDSNFS